MIEIIAEAGVDHEGSFYRACALLDIAATAGANTFKMQHFKKGLRGPNRELPHLSSETLRNIKILCEEKGLEFLCTPHDLWALDELERLDLVSRYKIGSGGWHLIPMAQQTGKPLLVSTGMHTMEEVLAMSDALKCEKLSKENSAILHCVSEYPCYEPYLLSIKYLHMRCDCKVGYSDHTSGTWACIAAAAMGAVIIEKHITLEKNVKNRQDTHCSADVDELTKIVEECGKALESCRTLQAAMTAGEAATKKWVDARNIDT
jgi:N,N'-diacetyllegionaminate synthase